MFLQCFWLWVCPTQLLSALKQNSRKVTTLSFGILQRQLPRPALLQQEKKIWMSGKVKQRCSEHCPSNCSTIKTLNSRNDNCRPRPRRLSQSLLLQATSRGAVGASKEGHQWKMNSFHRLRGSGRRAPKKSCLPFIHLSTLELKKKERQTDKCHRRKNKYF